MRLATFLLAGCTSFLPTLAAAQSGGALLFDGANDQVAINTTLGNFGTGDFTVEFFFKTTSAGSTLLTKRSFCGHQNFFQLSAGAGASGELDDNDTNYNVYGTGGGLNDNQWHHVAFTRTGGTARIFVDGVLGGTGTTAGATNLNNGNVLRIGTGPCVGANGSVNFQGTLDEMRFSNVNRYPGTVSFPRPTAPFSPDGNTLALYHFDEPSGQAVLDATGVNNAFLGTGSGAASDDPTRVLGDAPLPVELSGLTGSVSGGRVTLSWTTASERDNAGFTVVRDGVELATYRTASDLTGRGTTAQATSYRFADGAVAVGKSYVYRLRSTDLTGEVHDYPQSVRVEVTAESAPTALPTEFRLLPASPNPFNPTTTIRFELPEAATVTAVVYDALGRAVRTLAAGQVHAAGADSRLTLDAAGLASGTYVVRVQAVLTSGRTVVETQRVLLSR